ncbi:HNH endonuclease [Paraburkholderia sp. BL8N3]|nr:ABC-three component system protein [Paraburkholderia sp. BL8N3]TCK32623.1 HNH endonuclease [Paraburkholderia sp. BL8N3]
MAGKRDNYSDNEHSILYGETGGICPLCSNKILFTKPGSKKISKGYEVAHIYPLNPTPVQANALVGYRVPPLINALDNVIALCPTCHAKYDKDFQLSELVKLEGIKKQFLNDAKAKLSIFEYPLHEEIYEILDAIIDYNADSSNLESVNLDVSPVDKKLKTGMSNLQKREIKANAVDYYIRIRDHINRLEQMDQLSVKLLQGQINNYYLVMQIQHPDDKDLVFNYIAEWMSEKSKKSILASKILTSFFLRLVPQFRREGSGRG